MYNLSSREVDILMQFNCQNPLEDGERHVKIPSSCIPQFDLNF